MARKAGEGAEQDNHRTSATKMLRSKALLVSRKSLPSAATRLHTLAYTSVAEALQHSSTPSASELPPWRRSACRATTSPQLRAPERSTRRHEATRRR